MFKTKTVDNVLSRFTKTLKDLEKIAAEQEAAALKNDEESMRLAVEAENRRTEAFRASKVAERISELIKG